MRVTFSYTNHSKSILWKNRDFETTTKWNNDKITKILCKDSVSIWIKDVLLDKDSIKVLWLNITHNNKAITW